ncbi:ABC transporter ATP-binding protein [Gleimia sp. 6138-11-ORH1]|uniref:ABC transporter ATP-binding protein n=1 Tax=Gleimia sp. 6138-11-ORH1 TaxID=2973937 RepID=UPI002167B676|nr:ABC transporter ATP-binding protein [Gleimia sp. 6138-11-ORH1]MCS4484999.1 ABC transporter ATP-binding protein [Gleimia sp. 6138-11-ORH1]
MNLNVNQESNYNTGIYLRGLTKHYQREGVIVPALNEVTLHIARSSQVAIMGPSGCGKTTLLHTTAGILTPTAGSIRIEGQELAGMKETDLSTLRLRRFGFVFQDGQLLPELTNAENVALPLMLLGVPKKQALQKADTQLASLGLAGSGKYLPGQLSGGQAQRVAIARALVTNPQVVFADEPTGSLDQATSAEVMQVLTQATAQTGATLVVVTHDKGVASWLQHTIHMCDGKIESVVSRTSMAPSENKSTHPNTSAATPATASTANYATPYETAEKAEEN